VLSVLCGDRHVFAQGVSQVLPKSYSRRARGSLPWLKPHTRAAC